MISMVVIVLVTVIFLAASLSFRRNGDRSRFPPGNACLPLIGETSSFFKPHPLSKLPKFMEDRISRYGKIFSSHLMGRRMVISADAEFNRLVMKNEGRKFEETLIPGFTYSTDASVRKLLRTIMMEFFAGKRLQAVFLEDADTYTSHLLGSWKCGSVVSIKDETTKYSWHFPLKRILGMSPEDSKVEMLMVEYDKFVSGLFSLPLGMPGTNIWRTIRSSTGIKVTNNFMAFAGGDRYCPGAELAKLRIAVFLHHLIVKYDWEPAEPDHPIKLPFVTFPKGLPIKIRAAS